MTRNDHRWTDEEVEKTIGSVLRIGVTLAAAIVLAGAAVYLVRHGAERPDFDAFRGEPSDLKTVSGIWRLTLTGHGRGFIQLGLLLLVATPIARVAFSLFAFVRQRDYLYAAVTALVLGTLVYALLGQAG